MKNGVKLIIIGLGCSLGAIVRNLAIITVGKAFSVPSAIILANVIGCFIMGLFTAWGLKKFISATWLPFLTTGFCGGLTTFSEFADSSYQILIASYTFGALVYILATMLLGLGALWLGMYCVEGKQLKNVYRK
ncbi:putative fluoride ion transporter CrcB [Lactiplantibacillus plantarum]|nr:putative fluoride ion transporter CrcB [Lactiplantibacillus plantarum]MCG0675224.1 putative fluoride ion transporter CrcB [Lactiplantibacillus plantarum]MCG0810963.1 putative fluoride ion transporter CrcB [Lactiplantibacillus plantarum]MCG0863714.1 putative fluoride ion transporter CrcB [Lactiplantibacillus plantarum]MCG0885646.1 putative fluoride ion transporter CrcB [Lactiplantibacillus plantarum]